MNNVINRAQAIKTYGIETCGIAFSKGSQKDPASFEQFKWDANTLTAFRAKADADLELKLLQHPDLTKRERDLFYDKAFSNAMTLKRTDELKTVLGIVEKQAEKIEILESQLEYQGTITRERGEWIWEKLKTQEVRAGATTLYAVDAQKSLMKDAPPRIRIKPGAKNPYKLVMDAFKHARRLAEEAGAKVEKIIPFGKKLKCLRLYVNIKVPKRTEKKPRKVSGEPRQEAAWVRGYTGFFKDLRDPEPGG